jgi:hypothetical protein
VVMMARGGYFVLDREWKDGDSVTLKLPMEVKLRLWTGNNNSVSLDRGPITYALGIGEKWEKYAGTDEWPEWQVLPTTSWNYGLVLDGGPKSIEAVPKQWAQPPVNPLNRYDFELRAKAKKIPNWVVDQDNAVNPLQASPAASGEPTETVTLIPMGAARLRIASFPVIGPDGKGTEWKKPPPPPKLPLASHVFGSDTTAALNDGKEPKNSNDLGIPRMTWWPRKGSGEWVAYEFEKPKAVSKASVYWFDDRRTGGGCRVPASWTLMYQDASRGWRPVNVKGGAYGVEQDRYNTVEFEPVETTGLRLEAKLQKDLSGGILEWKVE